MAATWPLLFLVFFLSFVLADSGFLIDSPLRERKPLRPEEMEEIVFGHTFDEIELDAECHIEVDMQWMAVFGAVQLPNAPLIGDFRNDGSKEIVIATGKENIEMIEGEDGSKEPGWPYHIPDRSFSSSPIDYDLTGGSTRDIVISTDDAEIVFLSETGFPYHGSSLKVPNLPVEREWYHDFLRQNQTLFEPLYFQLPSTAERKRECEVLSEKYLKFYEESRASAQRQAPGTEVEYQKKFQAVLLSHLEEQQKKVTEHIKSLEFQVQKNRRLHEVDEELDDLEDDQGARMMDDHDRVTSSVHTFDGMQGWLTNDGVESLELFLPTETGTSFVTSLRSTANILYSPQLENYKSVGRRKLLPSQVKLSARIVGSPVIVDLEGDGHNEIVVAVNYAPKMSKKNAPSAHMYVANAIVAFDMMLHQIKWISPLELSNYDPEYRAVFMNGPTIIDLDGDGALNIVIGSMMGHIHVLDNYGIPIKGFPVAMGSIVAPVVVEDIDEDGKLEIIGMDSISNLAVFSRKGKMKWNIQLTQGCLTAPAIADINNDGTLDFVIACTSGVIHVIDAFGEEVAPFPIRQEAGMRGSPTIMKMKDNEHFHILSMASSGHLYITDGVDGCTEVVDIGLGAGLMAPMILADDVTGNGMMDLIVTTGFRFMYCLSTDTPYHPLNAWTSASHKRNVFTSFYHQGIFVTEEHRDHRDISGDSFLLTFEIVDNRENTENAYYNVQIKLQRNLDPLFAGQFDSPGVKSVTITAPKDRIAGTLRIEMTNEHQQFFSDSISLTFNVYFYRSIKWAVVVPFTICAVFLFFLKREFVEMVI